MSGQGGAAGVKDLFSRLSTLSFASTPVGGGTPGGGGGASRLSSPNGLFVRTRAFTVGRRRKVSAKATSPDGGVLQQESGQRRSAWNHRPGAEAPCRQVPASPIKEMELCTTGSAKPRRQPRGRLRLLASRGLCLALATPNPPSPRAAQSFPPDGTTLPLLGARAQPAAEAPASASATSHHLERHHGARGGQIPRVARPVFQAVWSSV